MKPADAIGLQLRLSGVKVLLAADDQSRYPAGSPKGGQFKPKAGGDSSGGSGSASTSTGETRHNDIDALIKEYTVGGATNPSESEHIKDVLESLDKYQKTLESLDKIKLKGDPKQTKAMKDAIKRSINTEVGDLGKELESLRPAPTAKEIQDRKAQKTHEQIQKNIEQNRKTNQHVNQLFADGAAVITGVVAGVLSQFSVDTKRLERGGLLGPNPNESRAVKDTVKTIVRSPSEIGKASYNAGEAVGKAIAHAARATKEWYANAAKAGAVKQAKVKEILEKSKASAAKITEVDLDQVAETPPTSQALEEAATKHFSKSMKVFGVPVSVSLAITNGR